MKRVLSFDFDRLNHILIPATKEGRDRFRYGLFGRLMRPVAFVHERLSKEGAVMALTAVLFTLVGLDIRSSHGFVVWGVLMGLVAVSLMISPLLGCQDLRLEVRAPRHVLQGEEAVFSAVVSNGGGRRHASLRVVGPFLPWDGKWLQDTSGIARLGPGESEWVTLKARFRARGEHHLDPFRVAALVPYGLAVGPSVRSEGVRFIVVPPPATVASWRFTFPAQSRAIGVRRVSRNAHGQVLLGVRPYRPSDPVRHLHARSWARVGQPVVREFSEETDSNVVVIVDVFDTRDDRSFDALLRLAGGAIGAVLRSDLEVTTLILGTKAHDLTVGGAHRALERALEHLAMASPAPAVESFDSQRLFSLVTLGKVRPSALVVLSTRSDEQRQAFVRTARSSGMAVLPAVVGDGAPEGWCAVDVARVLRQEPVILG